MENVARLEPKKTETKVVPAIGVSLAINIGGDRQLTVQTHVGQDDSDEDCNAVLDKLRRLGARQKAFADIDRLNDELADHRKSLARFEEDLSRAEAAHAAKRETKIAELAELRRKAEKITNDAYDRAQGQGKRGSFELRGADKANRDRVVSDMVRIENEMQGCENERTQHIDQLQKSMQRYREEIALRERRLAEAKALTGEA